MSKLAFVFHSSPHQTSAGREALDAVLAASAYSEEISVFFIGEGVLQLLRDQQPDLILSRNYISAFKLLDLYDIEDRVICQDSLIEWGIDANELVIDGEIIERNQLALRLSRFDKIINY
ncbi:sulfurtransferase complex subunit TusC [Vibrio tritonius]|uniref:Protein TusC homolog n=1 Tax=Vibrio tritonius TaxID=1435069 RepID=A0ABS7YMD2_9VIBR|nr:sulfurtransferase complex subunit TusC [Vibrio tritonius]MCA2016845.1 sulfurtransferase complex subunit TusC [Vibrio tritonius]